MHVHLGLRYQMPAIDTQRGRDRDKTHSFVRSIKAESLSINKLNKTPPGICAEDNKQPQQRPQKSSVRALKTYENDTHSHIYLFICLFHEAFTG